MDSISNSPSLSPKEEARAGQRALKQLFAHVRGWLWAGRALATISGVLAIAPYVALVHIGELLWNAGSIEAIDAAGVRRWVFILLGTFTLRLFLHAMALLCTHYADLKLGHHIRSGLVDTLAHLPLAWFSTTSSGRVRKTLQDDITSIHVLIAHQPVEVTAAVVTPLTLGIYAFMIDWRLGLLTICIIPVSGLAMATTMRGMNEKTAEMDHKLARISSTAIEFITGITVVKAFGTAGQAHRNYQDAADDFSTFYLNWVGPLMFMSKVSQALFSVPLILVVNVGGGAWLVNQGYVGAGDVLATSLIALVLPASLEVLSGSQWNYQIAGAAARRIIGFLAEPPLAANGAAEPADHSVEFSHVSYSYGEREAIHDVSFSLRQGTVTALLGPSGSGKSTLATLLARFDDPASGSITIGGVNVAEVHNIYQHVGFVLQDPQLLNLSLRENIALGKPDATDAEIRAAAHAACILEEIDALPAGFETIYGTEAGLSGGQAQRIAIARTMLADCPILILDEATALADPESQAHIQQALTRLVAGRTVLVIAHRPEAITGVDHIVVLDDGRVVAQGTHAELADQPFYRTLWRSAAARQS